MTSSTHPDSAARSDIPFGVSLLPPWIHRNRKRILITVLLLLILLILGYYASRWLSKSKSRRFYREGITELEQHDENTAEAFFKSAIELDPEFADAHCALGKVSIEKDELYTAESYFSTAIELDPEHGEAYFLYGKVLLRQRKWSGASDKLSHAVKLDYKKTEAYFNRGIAFENLNTQDNLDRALRDYTRAIRLKPSLHSAYYRRALINFDRQAYKEAVADLTLAISYKTNSANYYRKRADAYLALEQYDKAIEDFDHAEPLEPENDSIYRKRAECYVALGSLDKSIDDLGKAIKWAADKTARVNALVRRAQLHLLQGNYQATVVDAHKAISLDKHEANAFAVRGQARTKKRQWHDAISDFNRAFELQSRNNDNTDLYLSRGECYLEIGKIAEAIKDLSRVIGNDPGKVKAYVLRSQAFEAQMELEQAINDLNQAIELDDKANQPYFRRGLLFARTGKHKTAIDDFTRSLEINEEQPKAYFGRAESRVACEEDEPAIQDYTAALQLKPYYKEALVGRAKTYQRLGNLEKAIKDWTTVIYNEPKHVTAWVERGRILLAQKDYQKAIEDFEEAIKLDTSVLNLLREEYATAYCKQGEVLMAGGKYQEALRLFATVEQIDPKKYLELKSLQSGCWLQIGLQYRRKNQVEAAIGAFSNSIRFNSQESESYLERGELYLETGNATDAHADFSKVFEQRPREIRALVGRGIAHQRLAKFDEAITDFNAALKIDGMYIPALFGRGEVYLAKHDYDRAIPDLRKAHRGGEPKAKGKLIRSLLMRVDIKFTEKDYTLALMDLNEVSDLDPKLAPLVNAKLVKVHFAKGKDFFENGKPNSAVAELTRAIDLSGKDPMAFIIRGNCYRQLKQFVPALADYEKANVLINQKPGLTSREVRVRVLLGIGEIEFESSETVQNPNARGQQLSRAIDAFGRAIKEAGADTDPQLVANAYLGRARARVELPAANPVERETELKFAIEDYNHALSQKGTRAPQLISELAETTSKLALFYYNSAQQTALTPRMTIKGLSDALIQFNLAIGLKKEIGRRDAALDQSVVNTLVQRAQIFVQVNELSAALADFEQILQLDPKQRPILATDISTTYFRRGKTHYQAKDFQAAISDYKKATDFKSTIETDHWHGLAESSLGLQSLTESTDSHFESVNHLEKAINLNDKLETIQPLIELLRFQAECNVNQDVLNDLAKELATTHQQPEFTIRIETAANTRETILRDLDIARAALGPTKNPATIQITFSRIIEQGRVTPLAYLSRGLAYSKQDMTELAKLDFKIATFMEQLPDLEQITRPRSSYFSKVQGPDRAILLQQKDGSSNLAQAKLMSRKDKKGRLVKAVQSEIEQLEK